MKKYIIISLILIGTIQLSASVWQRVEGPTERKEVTSIFNFNNQIYASCRDGLYLTDDEGNWQRNEHFIFDSTGIVRVFYQKNNVALISGLTGKLYVSYNNGINWTNIKNIRNAMFGYESVQIIGETIFAQEHFTSKCLYKLENGSKDWEKVYLDFEKKDSIDARKLVSDGNYLFAGGTQESGITVSSDKGNSWYKLDNFKKQVTSMVIHNNKLFVACSDNYIYRTSDKGVTWEVDTNLIMPTDHFLSHNGNLYAAVNNTASIYSGDYGLLMSSDDGITWEKRSGGLNSINYKDIKVKDSKLYILTDRNTVFESTNNGINWSKSKLLDVNINSKKIIFDDDTLYVTASFGIFFSTDKGENWNDRSENLSSKFNRTRNLYKYKNTFVIDEQYSMALYISSDSGEKWNVANITGEMGWVGRVLILQDKIVVFSNKESTKTSYTTDYGETWQVYNDPVLKNEYKIGKLIREDEFNLTLFTSGGILKSSNNGINWDNVGESNPIDISPLIVNGKIIYGFNSELNIYKSTDKGFNWQPLGYKLTDNKGFIFEMIENNLIIPTQNGIKVSADLGKTFNEYLIDSTLLKASHILFGDIIQQEDYVIASSPEGVWRAKLSDLGIEVETSIESEIERNYLYTYPPYPLPAKSEVKVLFYWDINLPMTLDDISIYDLNGNKIPTTGNLRLEKQASHNGNLIWDCSSAQSGVYVINIKHGTEEKSVKVIVE